MNTEQKRRGFEGVPLRVIDSRSSLATLVVVVAVAAAASSSGGSIDIIRT